MTSSSSTDKKYSRAWVFTLQLGEAKLPSEQNFLFRSPPCVFLVYQLEIAPSTKQPHLQGYIEFNASKTFSQVRSYFAPHNPHIEFRKGTAAQAYAYCTKEETRHPDTVPVVLGTAPKRLAKTVLQAGAYKKKAKKKSDKEILLELNERSHAQEWLDEQYAEEKSMWEETCQGYEHNLIMLMSKLRIHEEHPKLSVQTEKLAAIRSQLEEAKEDLQKCLNNKPVRRIAS